MQNEPQKSRGGRFLTTRWGLIHSAASGAESQQEALDELLRHYLPALKEFLVLRFGVGADFADDLLQSFVLEKILKKQLIAQARRERGKFRTFLLNAIYRFTISEMRRMQAQKRVPQRALVGLDELADGDQIALIDEQASRQFDLAFTRQVLNEAVERMRAHCEKIKRPDIWGVFEARSLKPAFEDADPLPYDILIERFGFRSPDHAANAFVSGKRMFTRFLRFVVAQYTLDGGEVDDEIRALKAVLERA